MVDLLDEVKEDMRRERYQKLFTTYGVYVIGVTLALLLGTGLYTYYMESAKQERHQASREFLAASETQKEAELAPESLGQVETAAGDPNVATELNKEEKLLSAADEFEAISRSGLEGYAELAGIRHAGLLAQAGKQEEAVKAYDAVVADSSTDKAIRDYAQLQAVSLMIEMPNEDGSLDQEIDQRLASLSSEDNAWRYSAMEMRAYRALSQGNDEKALELFNQLVRDTNIPEAMFERTTKVVSLLKRDLPQATDATQAEDSADAE